MSAELGSHSTDRSNTIDTADGHDGRRRKPFNPIKSLKKFFGTSGGGGGGVGSTRIRTLSGGEDRNKEPELSTMKARSTTDMLGAMATETVSNELTVGPCNKKQLSMSADSVFSSSVGLSLARESMGPIDTINNTSIDSLNHVRQKEEILLERSSKEIFEGGVGLLKGSKAEEDEGHPRSPLTLATTADVITENNGQQLNKWPSFDSGHSLLSVDSSENELDEQDIFKDKWQTSGSSNQPKLRTGSDPSDNQHEMDLSVVRRHTSLKSSAVAHRLAVKPKNKRVSTAYQQKIQAYAATQKPAEFIEILPELEEEAPAVDKETAEEIASKRNLAAEATKVVLRRTTVKDPFDTEATSGQESFGVIRRTLKDPSVTSEERNSRRQTIAISTEVTQPAESKIVKRSSIHLNDKNRSAQQTETVNELNQVFSRIQRKSSQRQNEKPEVSVKPGNALSLPSQQAADSDKMKQNNNVLESDSSKSDAKVSNGKPTNDSSDKVETSSNGIDVKTEVKPSKAKEVDSSRDAKVNIVSANLPKKDSSSVEAKPAGIESSVKLSTSSKVEHTAPVSSSNINSVRNRIDSAVRIEPVVSGTTVDQKSSSETTKSQDKFVLPDPKLKEKSVANSDDLRIKSKLTSLDSTKIILDSNKDVPEKPKQSAIIPDQKHVIQPVTRGIPTLKQQENDSKPTVVMSLKQDESRSIIPGVSVKKSNSISYKATPTVPSESGLSKTSPIIIDRNLSVDSSLSSSDKIELTKVSPPVSIGSSKTLHSTASDDKSSKATTDSKNTEVVREGSIKPIAPSNQRVMPVGPSIKPNSTTPPKIGLQLKSSQSVKPSDNLPLVVSTANQASSMSKSLDSAELCRTTGSLTMTASTTNVSSDIKHVINTAATANAAPGVTKVKPPPNSKTKAEPEWFAMARQKTREWSSDKL